MLVVRYVPMTGHCSMIAAPFPRIGSRIGAVSRVAPLALRTWLHRLAARNPLVFKEIVKVFLDVRRGPLPSEKPTVSREVTFTSTMNEPQAIAHCAPARGARGERGQGPGASGFFAPLHSGRFDFERTGESCI